MFLSKDRQKFVRAVGILIAIQGLTWFILAIAGIIVKHSPPDRLKGTDATAYTRYSDYLSKIIYDDFMTHSIIRTESKVIRPKDFEAFLWIYAMLSALWIAVALDQNFAIRQNKPRQAYNTLVLGVAMLVTSVIDLVFVSLLARDFAMCPFDLGTTDTTTATPTTSSVSTASSTSTTTITTTVSTTTTAASTTISTSPTPQQLLASASSPGTPIDCQIANGIVMSLAARGYVLWLMNVVLGIRLIKIGAKALRVPTILTYEHNPIPRIKLPEPRKVAPSPADNMNSMGENGYSPSVISMNGSGNRYSTPLALSNKNRNIYY